MSNAKHEPEITVLMPCLNEAETLETCLRKAQSWIDRSGVSAEILVADNGSTDGSQEIALACGARVEHVPIRGYGAALGSGLRAAKGTFVIMGDADDSYDFSDLDAFVAELRAGHDLVMGNRFQGGIAPGAMPALHRYLGNPVLSFIGRRLFGVRTGDFHCGLRGIRRQTALDLQLQTTGMEFASEMVVRAALAGVDIAEVPTTLRPDGRSRPPHLRTWRDGWRHLRFLLLFSPRWLFLLPGLSLAIVGAVLSIYLAFNDITLGSVVLSTGTMLLASALLIVGVQSLQFAFFSKLYCVARGLLPEDKRLARVRSVISLERGLVIGLTLVVAGLVLGLRFLSDWQASDFGDLDRIHVARAGIIAMDLLVLGALQVLSSFFASVLDLDLQPPPPAPADQRLSDLQT